MAEPLPQRVVLDTNVIISGLLWAGSSHKIIEIAEQKKIKIYASPEILIEFSEVIRREKFSKRITELKTSVVELTVGFLRLVEIINIKKVRLDPHEKPTDSDDEVFILCALSAKVSFLVTGDPHLSSLKEIRGIKILTPHEFLRNTSFQ